MIDYLCPGHIGALCHFPGCDKNSHSFLCLINVSYSVCVWQAYNGKKTTFETDHGARGGTQLEVECVKGYRTIKGLGTTDPPIRNACFPFLLQNVLKQCALVNTWLKLISPHLCWLCFGLLSGLLLLRLFIIYNFTYRLGKRYNAFFIWLGIWTIY
jgi:hypothetical protein